MPHVPHPASARLCSALARPVRYRGIRRNRRAGRCVTRADVCHCRIDECDGRFRRSGRRNFLNFKQSHWKKWITYKLAEHPGDWRRWGRSRRQRCFQCRINRSLRRRWRWGRKQLSSRFCWRAGHQRIQRRRLGEQHQQRTRRQQQQPLGRWRWRRSQCFGNRRDPRRQLCDRW